MPIRMDDNHEDEADQVCIEISEKNKKKEVSTIEVVDKVSERLDQNTASWTMVESEASIYKIPEFMREVQPRAFEPRLVSFGPYHHGEQHLVWMEQEKLRAFHGFRTRHGLEVAEIVEKVGSMLKDLQASYEQLEDEWKEDPDGKFLQLMIVDGCFMLECFDNCPKLLTHIRWDIRRDMLLLENQLPMKLLEELYSMTNRNKNQKNVKSLVSDFMCFKNKNKLDGKYLHILDMYKEDLLQPPIDRRKGRLLVDELQLTFELIIPPASELRKARIKFRSSPSWSFRDVDFEGGVLRLPRMEVDDDTESSLLNVMAFEKLHVGGGGEVTSFIILMNNLIRTDKDVELLVSEGIFVNALGDDQSAVDLFKRLTKGAIMDFDSHIPEVYRKVNKHRLRAWHVYNVRHWYEWVASLKQDYLRNPWTVISVIAAFIGFAILLLQAVYQVREYYRRQS